MVIPQMKHDKRHPLCFRLEVPVALLIQRERDPFAAVTAPIGPVPLRGGQIPAVLRVVADRPVFRQPLPRRELPLRYRRHALTVSMSARIRFIRHFW